MIIKEKTCAITGHRKIYGQLNRENLKKSFIELIENGYNTFLNGMAIGFDSICFRILLELKEKYPIKIIACIPCENQAERFNNIQKKEYERLLSLVDEKILINKEYTAYCMMKRNKFMVDNASFLIAYLREEKGGTFKTVNYAKEKGLQIKIT